MKKINLKILNETGPATVQYLPYGVTTIEMQIEGDNNDIEGIVYPRNRTAGRNKFHLGYADDCKDFLIIWGAGKQEGLSVNTKNADKRLFLQILHKGEKISRQRLTLHHNNLIIPLHVIELIPAVEDANAVRMILQREGGFCNITFTGNTMPLYYPRWFPPGSYRGNAIRYFNVEAPSITIKFRSKEDEVSTNVNSDMDIFLHEKKIAQITGDWRYSWPHAEIFTVFGDNEYLILRFWLYWIHENYSRNIFLGGIAQLGKQDRPENEQARRGLWEAIDIECPDIERFDFLIDMKNRKFSWMGTDFHYQEYWYMLEDVEFIKARIANDVETIVQVLRNIKNRLNPQENYNPVENLKKILKCGDIENLDPVFVPSAKDNSIFNFNDKGNVKYRAGGITRKHVPYIENGKLIVQLVSSVVTL